MKKILILCFCVLNWGALSAQNTAKPKQFIPNPAFQVTTNDLLLKRLVAESGYPSINLIPADKLKKIAEKLSEDTNSIAKVDGWGIWHNLHKRSEQARTLEKIKDDSARIYLQLESPYCLGTYLNAPLEAGKVYELTFEYIYQPKIQDLPAHLLPTISFAFLPDSPQNITSSIKPQKKYKFKQDKDAHAYKKRQKLINSYQKEYGGNYEGKEWRDFQGKRLAKEKYEKITLTYQAEGGERYFAFGNFSDKKDARNFPLPITMYRLYLYELKKSSTFDEK